VDGLVGLAAATRHRRMQLLRCEIPCCRTFLADAVAGLPQGSGCQLWLPHQLYICSMLGPFGLPRASAKTSVNSFVHVMSASL
jgi:hypothetical protein